MSNYAEESNSNFPKTKIFNLKPDPRYETKLKNAARRVISEGNDYTRLHLAGWANLDISEPVIRQVIKLETDSLPTGELFETMCGMYLDARNNEDKTRQIAFAAFLGVNVLTETEYL
jgi:hypothetical protein